MNACTHTCDQNAGRQVLPKRLLAAALPLSSGCSRQQMRQRSASLPRRAPLPARTPASCPSPVPPRHLEALLQQ